MRLKLNKYPLVLFVIISSLLKISSQNNSLNTFSRILDGGWDPNAKLYIPEIDTCIDIIYYEEIDFRTISERIVFYEQDEYERIEINIDSLSTYEPIKRVLWQHPELENKIEISPVRLNQYKYDKNVCIDKYEYKRHSQPQGEFSTSGGREVHRINKERLLTTFLNEKEEISKLYIYFIQDDKIYAEEIEAIRYDTELGKILEHSLRSGDTVELEICRLLYDCTDEDARKRFHTSTLAARTYWAGREISIPESLFDFYSSKN